MRRLRMSSALPPAHSRDGSAIRGFLFFIRGPAKRSVGSFPTPLIAVCGGKASVFIRVHPWLHFQLPRRRMRRLRMSSALSPAHSRAGSAIRGFFFFIRCPAKRSVGSFPTPLIAVCGGKASVFIRVHPCSEKTHLHFEVWCFSIFRSIKFPRVNARA